MRERIVVGEDFARDLSQSAGVVPGTVRGAHRKLRALKCASINVTNAATEVRSNTLRLRAISRARKERSRGQ